MTDRADPIHNESLRQLMQDSCREFDRRGLLPQSTSAAFARLVVQPTLLDWTICTLALSAEMHLRSMERQRREAGSLQAGECFGQAFAEPFFPAARNGSPSVNRTPCN